MTKIIRTPTRVEGGITPEEKARLDEHARSRPMTEIDTNRERLERLQSIGCADYLHMAILARAEKAEAERDTEWNNAIRAAIVRLGVLIDRPGAKADRELVRGIRELLREGVTMRCAECDCENGGADCNWIASGDKEGGAA